MSALHSEERLALDSAQRHLLAGFSCSTEVEDGVVVRRTVTTRAAEGEEETWTEPGAEIGARQECFAPRLLEPLYDPCLAETLCQVPSRSSISLASSEADGILRTCSYFPEGCADDCSLGVSLDLTLL